MDTPILLGEQILDYIPQRPPMVMIDSFFGINGETSETGLTITEKNIFSVDNQLMDGGIIENIAQSGAMHIGYQCKSEGKAIPLGFIGSVNKLSVNRLPNVGETIRTQIVMETRVFDITLIGATVKIGDEVIAQCKMKVATPE